MVTLIDTWIKKKKKKSHYIALATLELSLCTLR